jgi:CheY-like chemotaxis protein
VVLLTADARLDEKAATPGFVDVLKKPLSVDELMAIVERHCA